MTTIEGVVVRGRRLGRELGFPTANIEVAESLALEDGVYLARVWLPEDEQPLPAVSNLGRNPSVGGCERRLESHLLDYAGEDLYGKRLRVELLERLRKERHFDSLEALRHQIEEDITTARKRYAGGEI